MTVLDPSGHLQNSYPSGKGSILISHHYDFPPKNNGKFNSQTILVRRRDRRSFFQDTIFLKNISYIAGEVLCRKRKRSIAGAESLEEMPCCEL